MSMHDTLNAVFQEAIHEFNQCAGMQRFWNRELSVPHYAALMREIFHHSRENPQIQAAATVYFRGAQREMVKPFLRHAISEVGHDQLALNDVAALGVDVADIPTQLPLPATTALIAFPYYQIFNLNAVGYLGYLYFLEAMPTTFGHDYMAVLTDMGIGKPAMSFLSDHTVIDVGHTKAMRGYIRALVRTQADLEAAAYALRVTGQLYSRMLTDAFADADTPMLLGTNREELLRRAS